MYSLTVDYPDDVQSKFGKHLSHEGLVKCNGKYPIRIEDFVFLYIALCERLCLTVSASDFAKEGDCIFFAHLRKKVIDARNSQPLRYYLLSKNFTVGGTITELDPSSPSHTNALIHALGGGDLGDITFKTMEVGTCFKKKDIEDVYSFVKDTKYIAFKEATYYTTEGMVCCDSLTTGDWTKCKDYYYDKDVGVTSSACDDRSDKQLAKSPLGECISIYRSAHKDVYCVYKLKKTYASGYSDYELAGSGLQSCYTETFTHRPKDGSSGEDWCESKITVTLPEPLASKVVGFRIVWDVRMHTWEYGERKKDRYFIVPDDNVYEGSSAVVSTSGLGKFCDYISDIMPSEGDLLDSIEYPELDCSSEYTVPTGEVPNGWAKASAWADWESYYVSPIVVAEVSWNTYFSGGQS